MQTGSLEGEGLKLKEVLAMLFERGNKYEPEAQSLEANKRTGHDNHDSAVSFS